MPSQKLNLSCAKEERNSHPPRRISFAGLRSASSCAPHFHIIYISSLAISLHSKNFIQHFVNRNFPIMELCRFGFATANRDWPGVEKICNSSVTRSTQNIEGGNSGLSNESLAKTEVSSSKKAINITLRSRLS